MREQVLEAVRGGESISGACRRLGVPRQTVYSWREQDARFREQLSEALSGRRQMVPGAPLAAVKVVPGAPLSDPDAPLPSRDELLALLAEQARNGSTRATELLLRETAPERPTDARLSARQRATANRLLGLVR